MDPWISPTSSSECTSFSLVWPIPLCLFLLHCRPARTSKLPGVALLSLLRCHLNEPGHRYARRLRGRRPRSTLNGPGARRDLLVRFPCQHLLRSVGMSPRSPRLRPTNSSRSWTRRTKVLSRAMWRCLSCYRVSWMREPWLLSGTNRQARRADATGILPISNTRAV